MPTNTRRLLIAFSLLLTVTHQLPAQSSAANVFGGWSYIKANPESTLPRSSMNGWVASVEGYATKWFGVGFEIAGQFGSISGPSGINAPSLSSKEYSYMAGPQFRFLNHARVQSSVRLLAGGVFGQVNLSSSASAAAISQLGAAGYLGFNQTKFAALFAVPVDVTVSKLLAIRVEPGLYLTNFNQSGQGNFRVSVGPVFRFGKRE